ncbi:amidase domain-containing protein [Tissierella sp. Yu-01]|uniref:amidase domain-containing protein n=1 Tax=Tissierella sp. Yu-01 TaxID=3035694 RepID=UPI00240D1EB5|nr:amidase domain-containing protein [Tissierella sp. Yu-01]WFA10114.1 amidase domain-containing protein [Tissierella sp. Yu-01]
MLKKVIIIVIIFIIIGVRICFYSQKSITSYVRFKHDEHIMLDELQQIFDRRNKALLEKDVGFLKSLYYTDEINGYWSYENEIIKMNYLHNWAEKQSAIFTDIESKIFLRNLEEKLGGYYVSLAVTTKYTYQYNLESDEDKNSFGLGTYHTLDLIKDNNGWVITKEWYSDPCRDSLNLESLNLEFVKDIIKAGKPKNLSNLNENRKVAIDYADEHCGVARPPNYSFQYNNEYKNYNSIGGDCTNFASQVLHEGGGLSKTSTWNYEGGNGTKAWVNANAFNNYMQYSGRGTLIAKGTYEEVLKASYSLLPGDYIAYEKEGKVAHISIVSGMDPKGYALVNSHNADRYKVPWDLGWNTEGIIFWLVRINY